MSGVLVAGVGNVFHGDDGFGVEVAQRLLRQSLPEGIKVMDAGVSGVHLAFELLEGYDTLIMVDTGPVGAEAGSLAVLEPDLGDLAAVAREAGALRDSHSLDPVSVLSSAAAMGARTGRTLVVACRPADLSDGIGLSAPVEAALDAAVDTVTRLAIDELHRHRDDPASFRSGTLEIPVQRAKE